MLSTTTTEKPTTETSTTTKKSTTRSSKTASTTLQTTTSSTITSTQKEPSTPSESFNISTASSPTKPRTNMHHWNNLCYYPLEKLLSYFLLPLTCLDLCDPHILEFDILPDNYTTWLEIWSRRLKMLVFDVLLFQQAQQHKQSHQPPLNHQPPHLLQSWSHPQQSPLKIQSRHLSQQNKVQLSQLPPSQRWSLSLLQ